MDTSHLKDEPLEPRYGRFIINQLASTGTPPEFGLSHFTVGISQYLRLIKEEYLESYIPLGGSSFKLVISNYGGGKTHFLYCIRDLAWGLGYAISYIPLSPGECPFSRFDLVYKAIVSGLTYPIQTDQLLNPYERGIDAFIREWYMREAGRYKDRLDDYIAGIGGMESSSFTNAVKNAFLSLRSGGKDYDGIIQWLKGEEIDQDLRNRYGITERLDKTTPFRLIRSLAQWVKEIGYTGLVLLFDEAERGMSIGSLREKRVALDNLRQLIDECGNVRFPGVMIFYAIPDERQLLEERLETYEALRQRLSGFLTRVNPSGVRIQLEELDLPPKDFLIELGKRLSKVYESAYSPFRFQEGPLMGSIITLAEEAYGERYADVGYRRLFVKGVIQGFHILRKHPEKALTKMDAKRIVRDEIRGIEEGVRREAEEVEF